MPSRDRQLDVEDFLFNRLNDVERNDFEIELLENPELLREVQRNEKMIAALKESQVDLKLVQPIAKINSLRNWFVQPYSIAASLLVVIFATTTFMDIGGDSLLEDVALTEIENSVTLELLRGQDNQVLMSGDAPFLLTIDSGPTAYAEYDISFFDKGDNSVLFSQTGVRSDGDGWLRIVVNKRLSGDFSINLSRPGEVDIFSSYEIRFE